MKYTSTYINDLTLIQNNISNITKIKNSSFLITGATGLVCSAIVDFLINLNDTRSYGLHVYIAARNFEKTEERFGNFLSRNDVTFVEYDALNEINWNYNVDYIICGAGLANPPLYVKQPVETMLSNLNGVNNILMYSRHHDVKRVLFVSSSEVYGKKNNSEPYHDDEYGYVDILNPRACYPSAKRACETLCSSYYSEYNVDSVVVRLGHVYGPTARSSDKRASTQFFYDVIAEKDIIMKSAGTQLRSYCYIADCVSAIMTALIEGESTKAYNISNPKSVVTIRELADQIASSSGRKVLFENPSDEELKGYNLMDNSSLDSSSLIELGWKGAFSLKEGVEHTLKILQGQ